jgi:Uncharacterized conserved protein
MSTSLSEATAKGLIPADAIARLYGQPLLDLPKDLYIPPDALEVILEAFEGPLDLLLYLIRRQNFNILDIPMMEVTQQYLRYIDEVRLTNLELAAEYLLMAACLLKSSRACFFLSGPEMARRTLPIQELSLFAAFLNTKRLSLRPIK